MSEEPPTQTCVTCGAPAKNRVELATSDNPADPQWVTEWRCEGHRSEDQTIPDPEEPEPTP